MVNYKRPTPGYVTMNYQNTRNQYNKPENLRVKIQKGTGIWTELEFQSATVKLEDNGTKTPRQITKVK